MSADFSVFKESFENHTSDEIPSRRAVQQSFLLLPANRSGTYVLRTDLGADAATGVVRGIGAVIAMYPFLFLLLLTLALIMWGVGRVAGAVIGTRLTILPVRQRENAGRKVGKM